MMLISAVKSVFEIGEFDRSVADYLKSGMRMKAFSPEEGSLLDFSLGFIVGAKNGIIQASQEFIPSMLASAQGLGNFIWATLEHPIDNTKELTSAIIQFCTYLKNCDRAELVKFLVPEMYELVTEWDNLSFKKRGQLAGYCLGKYGVDILLPVAAVKGTKTVFAFYQLKQATKLCILETLASSTTAKEALAQSAVRWGEQRAAWFSKIELEIDKQSKHIPESRFYKEGKSIWTYPEPGKKVKELAGTGQRVRGKAGEVGYKERVDRKEVIGYYIESNSMKRQPTTMANIHYSKKGAHIVPAKPKKD